MIDYKQALYRRNNFDQPCVWYAEEYGNIGAIYHGIVNKTIRKESFIPKGKRSVLEEIKSRYNAKRKSGYLHLHELKDNMDSPVEDKDIFSFLCAYLPYDRTSNNGTLLPMLAKVYTDKSSIFNKDRRYFGQWKINGLRCFVSAEKDDSNLFETITLKFQSREGTYWKGLDVLKTHILNAIPASLLEAMIEEHYILDGEIYLPGYSVNQINHFVKDPTCKEHSLLQYWCYDIAIQEMSQIHRFNVIDKSIGQHKIQVFDLDTHLNNTKNFVVLPWFNISNHEGAVHHRNIFIDEGFEGLILREANSEYQYGKRNLTMLKYKKSTDGIFEIIDIYPEGKTRSDIPMLLLRNDINSEEFEVHLSGSQDYQREVLANKDNYIGKNAFVEFGERSGVKKVPFHVKEVKVMP